MVMIKTDIDINIFFPSRFTRPPSRPLRRGDGRGYNVMVVDLTLSSAWGVNTNATSTTTAAAEVAHVVSAISLVAIIGAAHFEKVSKERATGRDTDGENADVLFDAVLRLLLVPTATHTQTHTHRNRK